MPLSFKLYFIGIDFLRIEQNRIGLEAVHSYR